MSLNSTWNRHRSTWGAVLLLLLLPFVVFWQVWFPLANPRLLFEQGDFVEQNIAMRQFVAGELREGRLPLWDPYTYGGQPALSGTLFAPYYPLGGWQLLFPFPFPDWLLPIEVIFHLGIGGIGTYFLLRRLTDNQWAGTMAGITFQLSGWSTGYPMLQVGILETAVWLPWGLWLIERGMARKSWSDMAGVALIFGMALLAGHPQTLMYLAYLSAAYFSYRAIHYRVGYSFFVVGGVLIALGVLGIGAAQWLPAMEAYQYSPRLDLSYSEVGNGFQWAELAGIFIPNREGWSPLYVGPFALLALIILFLRRRGEFYFWGVVAGIALFISLGSNGWLYPIAYRLLPGFAIFRNQERIALLFMMAVVVLSGYGWHVWATRWRNHPKWHQVYRWIVPVAILLTLSFTNFGKILAPITEGYYPPSPVVDYLRSVGDSTWRMSSEGLLPDGPNGGMVYRLRDVVGNSPLHLAALDDFTTTVPELRWWQMLNIQHLLTTRTFPENAPLVPVMSTEQGTLYQVFVNAPALWITHEYEVAASPTAAIVRTADASFNPMQRAILEEHPLLEPTPTSGNEIAHVTLFEPQRIVSEIQLNSPAVVVWSEIAYPGWVARVNGVEVRSLRAYGLLRALALPAGVQTVEWRFEPPLAYWGLGITAVAFLILVAIIGRERFFRISNSPPTNPFGNADP